MTAPAVSVIVVSRGRPAALALCLTGLFQLDYPAFEVIVVADAGSRPGVGVHQRRVKLVHFEAPNISAARNAGLGQAAGEIVAFIDDDAVPEPTWLTHLTAPIAAGAAEASGGYVIGRNGISFQWTARQVMTDGTSLPLDLAGDAPQVPEGIVVKTEGTNMAVRADVLRALGGFDEAFAFYLDETDLNMRLAAAGHRTALVPLAQVHHGYAASTRRTAARVPRDLTDIGASLAVFQRKHHTAPDPRPMRAAQRQRLLRHMVAGDLMPGEVWRLMRGFDRGWAQGLDRPADQHPELGTPGSFQPVTVAVTGHVTMRARFWQARRALARAAAAVAAGQRVTLYLFSLGPRRHRVSFTSEGVWVQRGGQFGKSRRSDPVWRWWRARLATPARSSTRPTLRRRTCTTTRGWRRCYGLSPATFQLSIVSTFTPTVRCIRFR